MEKEIHLSSWNSISDTIVKLLYKDGSSLLVKKSDFDSAFGTILSADKSIVLRDYAIQQ